MKAEKQLRKSDRNINLTKKYKFDKDIRILQLKIYRI